MHNATKNNQDDKVAKQREAIKNFRVKCSIHKDKKNISRKLETQESMGGCILNPQSG